MSQQKQLLLLLLALLFFVDGYSRPASIKLGGLYPLIKSDGKIDNGGKKRLLGFLMAIQEINNKTDGKYDSLLPQTTIEFSVRDSKRDSGVASVGALDLLRPEDGANSVVAIVGAASSGPSMSVQKVLSIFDVLQVSYSSTSAALSDDTVYPYFGRTPPTDSLQSQVMATFIKGRNWTHATTLCGDDSYSTGGIQDFKIEAVKLGIEIPVSKQFVRGTTLTDSIRTQLNEIKTSEVKLIVMYAQADDVVNVFKTAKELGMWGSDGYTWIMSELILGSYADLVTGLGSQSEVDKALRGAFSQAPSNGAGSKTYDDFETRWKAMADTSQGINGCSQQKDDDGYLLWQQNYDNAGLKKTPVDVNGTMTCSGFDPSSADGGITQYVPYSYDATVAVLHAIHGAIEAAQKTGAKSDFSGKALFAHLSASSFSFDGVSGLVSFAPNGDRGFGIPFKMYNHQAGKGGFGHTGNMLSDGTIDTSVGSVASTKWEYACGGSDAVCTAPLKAGEPVNLPDVLTKIFKSPELEGLCGPIDASGQCIDGCCSGHGVCSVLRRACECSPGYVGSLCQFPVYKNHSSGIQIKRCNAETKQGKVDDGNGECSCAFGFGGVECELNATSCPPTDQASRSGWIEDGGGGCCYDPSKNANAMIPSGPFSASVTLVELRHVRMSMCSEFLPHLFNN